MTSRKLTRERRSRFKARIYLKNSPKKLSGIKKRPRCRILIHPLRLSLWHTQTSKTAGYIKMIVGNVPANRGSTKPGAISKLTSKERLRKHEDHPGIRRPRDMQPMCNPHKPTRNCLPRCSGTTPR